MDVSRVAYLQGLIRLPDETATQPDSKVEVVYTSIANSITTPGVIGGPNSNVASTLAWSLQSRLPADLFQAATSVKSNL